MNPTLTPKLTLTINPRASLGTSLGIILERGLRCLMICTELRATIFCPRYLFLRDCGGRKTTLRTNTARVSEHLRSHIQPFQISISLPWAPMVDAPSPDPRARWRHPRFLGAQTLQSYGKIELKWPKLMSCELLCMCVVVAVVAVEVAVAVGEGTQQSWNEREPR